MNTLTVRVTGARDITLDHNTVFQTGNIASLGNCCGKPIKNLTVTNNVFGEGAYGWFVNSLGQSYKALTQVVDNLVFKNNVWAGDPGPYQYPGNFFPPTLDHVGFLNYNGGSNGDYRLASNSRYKKAATDGTDPGANMEMLKDVIAKAVAGRAGLLTTSGTETRTSGAHENRQ